MKEVIDKVTYKECDRCSGSGKIATVHSHTEPENEKERKNMKRIRRKYEKERKRYGKLE